MTRDESVNLMLMLEGGESNLKGDPGGHTKFGIIQTTLDRLRATALWSFLPASVADLTPEQAASIYKTVQWTAIHGDDLPPTLAPLVLNTAVNMGVSRAVMLLQDCVGVTSDGVMGPATLSCVGRWRSQYMRGQTLAEEYAAHVAARYAQLDTREDQFELGWFRRLFRVYTLASSSFT